MRRFEPVAGLGGVLLAASLFLPWYEVPLPPELETPPLEAPSPP
jgi:hypothetical protein